MRHLKRTVYMRSVKACGGFVLGVFVCACVVTLAGQARQPPSPDGTSEEQLLAEVRALRTEIAESANAAMRAQLLGMRLQLQEQRIGVIVRQLSDVQERVRSNDRAKDALAAQMKIFEGMVKTESQEKAEEFDRVIEPLRAQLASLETSDQSLKAEEASISGMLAQEQARWSTFNAQVEELEQSVIRKSPR
jgi:chromosome segregation ATPase